jgi:mono/diheme cytochrome c family protein
MVSAIVLFHTLLAILLLAFCVAAGAQQTQVQRDEYLAQAGDCISCHTSKAGMSFAGGARLNTSFGYMLAPNITPDQDTGIGQWSAGRVLSRVARRREQAQSGHVSDDAV